MKLRIFFLTVTLLFSAPAFADCVDTVCGSIQKILQARSSSFSKLKGKPGVDLIGDPAWAGTQAIPGVTDHCVVYKHGEGRRYEYRCIASELGTKASASLEKARQIGETLKAVSSRPTRSYCGSPTLTRSILRISMDFKARRVGTGAIHRRSLR